MDDELIPDLVEAWCEPGYSEPIYFGKLIVPRDFLTFFNFKTKGKEWVVEFRITVDEDGVPVVEHVLIRGNVERWKLKLVEQHRFQLVEIAFKVVVKTRLPKYMLRKEYEHYGIAGVATLRAFDVIGMTDSNPVLMELPTHLKGVPTDFVRYWGGKTEPVTAKEIKALLKEVSTRSRKKITKSFLKEVADLYRWAEKNGQNPHDVIMNAKGCKHRTSVEWVQKCRNPENNLLPKTKQGKKKI
jgi:hypothetical protein